jgi:hypothetical protein
MLCAACGRYTQKAFFTKSADYDLIRYVVAVQIGIFHVFKRQTPILHTRWLGWLWRRLIVTTTSSSAGCRGNDKKNQKDGPHDLTLQHHLEYLLGQE